MAGRLATSPPATPSYSSRLHITESSLRLAPNKLRVDREAGVIFGVKVLGWESDNNRSYVPEAAKRAVDSGLYNEAKVYCDHPDPEDIRKRKARDCDTGFGKLRNARFEPDGVYADLWFFKSHPMTERVLEDAERGMAFFGLSHNAQAGHYDIKDGKQVITEISQVFSVDLVTDAATVSSLWESRRKTIQLKNLFESLSTNPKVSVKTRRRLLEAMDDGMYEQEIPEPEPEASPEDMLKGGFESALHALATAALNGEMDEAEAITKFKDLLKGHNKLNGSGDKSDSGEGEGETITEDDKEDDDDKKKESKQPIAAPITEAKAKALCDLAGIPASADLLEAVQGCVSEEVAYKVIKLAKKPALSESRVGPRTTAPHRLTESRTAPETMPDKIEDLAKWAAGIN